MQVIVAIRALIDFILRYYYIVLCVFLLLGVVGCEYSLFKLPIFCSIFEYWYLFMLIGMLIYYYYNYKKYYGFTDNRAISVQYTPSKEKSLLRTCFVLGYNTNYEIISAAILELVQLGYIELTQEAPKYIPILHRKRKDTSYLTEDQVYIMDILLFHNCDKYKMYLLSGEKKERIKKSLLDLEKILEDWAIDGKYVIGNPIRIRDDFAKTTRLLLFIFLLPNLFILTPNLLWSFLVFTFTMFIVGITFLSFKKNIIETIYYILLFFIVFTFGLKKLFLNVDISILFNPSVYPMCAWQFTAILGVYVMWSFRGLGKKGASVEKHMLGYALFRKIVPKTNQEEDGNRKLYALHYDVKRMSASALSKYIYSILILKKIPKQIIVKE